MIEEKKYPITIAQWNQLSDKLLANGWQKVLLSERSVTLRDEALLNTWFNPLTESQVVMEIVLENYNSESTITISLRDHDGDGEAIATDIVVNGEVSYELTLSVFWGYCGEQKKKYITALSNQVGYKNNLLAN